MKNIPIITKFLMIMSAFGLFVLAVGGYVGNQMWTIDSSYSALGVGPTVAALSIARANRDVVGIKGAVADLLIASTDEGNRAAEREMDVNRKAFGVHMDEAVKADPTTAPKVEALKLQVGSVMDKTCAAAIKAGAESNTPAAVTAAQDMYLKDCAPAFPVLTAAMQAEAEVLTAAVAKQDDALTETTKGVIATTFVLILGGLVAILVFGFLAIRAWVVAPIKGLASTMDRLARGDLQADVAGVDRRDELGGMARAVQVFKDAGLDKQRLASEADALRGTTEQERRRNEEARVRGAKEQAEVVGAIGDGLERLSAGDLTFRIDQVFATEYEKLRADFNGAMAQLQKTMTTVVGRADGLRAGGAEITQASDDLARRTEQQAASLEETAAALAEITTTVKQTAEGALAAQKEVAAAKTDAEASGDVVRDAVGAMSRIEDSSRQIGQIIGVIDEIAFQTNLLALNAGVEAARAGEAGRGFAVVASEVRALAQRSADAAKEIKTLISASSIQVAQGAELVGETGRALGRIAERVTLINTSVSEIAASAQQQASGLHQVNAAVTQMDQVTQQNAAMVEQATAAAHSLREGTDALTALMSQFRVGDTGPRAVTDRPAVRKPNAVHAAQRKIANFVGGGRAKATRAAAASAPAAPAAWEEF